MTTDPDLNRNELFRTPTARELYKAGSVSRVGSLQKTAGGVELKIVSAEWFTSGGVAVTVAVHCSTPATFQAFTSDPLCAQDFCKLFVRCDLPYSNLLTVDDS